MLKLSIKKYKKVKSRKKAKAKAKTNAQVKAKIKIKIIFLIFLTIVFILNNISNILQNIKFNSKEKKRVGVVNIFIDLNIGNILVKYSVFKILEEMGFNDTIIVPKIGPINFNISFAKRTIGSHLLIVKRDFSELKEEDFDYLMVSSDQTWNGLNLNVGFLKFAENWNVKKFIYAASTGNHLPFRENNKILIKSLLKNFTGISFREKRMVKLLEENLGLKSEFVLDPTFLLSKNVYLNTIKNYQQYNFNKNDKFIFVYQLDRNYHIEKTIKKASELFNFKINKLQLKNNDYMESFFYGMNNCQAIITDSFHGTVFSIIFNKPFLAFSNSFRGKARFDSLKELFSLDNRIIEPSSYSNIDINLLIEPLNIDKSKFKEMKKFSLNYLKRNLDLA